LTCRAQYKGIESLETPLSVTGNPVYLSNHNPGGCVAKIDERRQESGLDFLLGGDSEEAVRKSQLSPNGAFAHSVDLAFSDHDHRLESFDGIDVVGVIR
jgi:hypothetical protein